MSGNLGSIAGICVAVLFAVGLAAQAGTPDPKRQGDGMMKMTAEQIIASWKMAPKEAAQKMIKKYGQPAEATAMRLVWHDNGPWKVTEVMNKEIEHNFPIPHKDVMYQGVAYRIDPDDANDILEFDGSVLLDRTQGMIGATCDKEEANFLAVNLADDVANGKRSVDDARRHYAESIMMMMKEGKTNEYMTGLRFKPPMNAGFTDKPFGPVGTSGKK